MPGQKDEYDSPGLSGPAEFPLKGEYFATAYSPLDDQQVTIGILDPDIARP
jgi:hypothetical protein